MQKKNFDTPDETRALPKTKIDIIRMGDSTFMRATFEPGWRWSEHVKPTVGGDSCQVHHVGYSISGRMKAVMSDGTEMEFGPGDVTDIPPGHNAWVIGDEPAVGVDVTAGDTYGKPS